MSSQDDPTILPAPAPPITTPSAADLHFSLLRLSILRLLSSTTTLTTCRPSVIDALTDLAVRHLQLLCEHAKKAANSAGRALVDVQDVRYAMEGTGVIRPRGTVEFDDTRGVDAFVEWAIAFSKAMGSGVPKDKTATTTEPTGTTTTTDTKREGEVPWLLGMMERGVGEGFDRWKGTVLAYEREATVGEVVIEGAMEKLREPQQLRSGTVEMKSPEGTPVREDTVMKDEEEVVKSEQTPAPS
ncbi:hypothetical protein BJ508DRAFT_328474 [Ascobolus immersus RN42]|uniref:Bromodomain associated domain-containing protein n=1 Tax=Ascobolus immersus RN42 TaxID=1160509 RepID=A0A3N4HZW2_ASCIM|nr:hypothetical protein BJ508DRAFT_328474 [Ascobolus immersus RN42]